jgi:hypothetical protein
MPTSTSLEVSRAFQGLGSSILSSVRAHGSLSHVRYRVWLTMLRMTFEEIVSPFSLKPSSTGTLISFDTALCPSCFCFLGAFCPPDACFLFLCTIAEQAIKKELLELDYELGWQERLLSLCTITSQSVGRKKLHVPGKEWPFHRQSLHDLRN